MRLVKYNVYRYIGCLIDQSNWSGPFSLMALECKFLFTGLFLLLLHMVPAATIRVQG